MEELLDDDAEDEEGGGAFTAVAKQRQVHRKADTRLAR